MAMTGLALDGARRRRIHLLRHAEAAYFDAEGRRTGDSRAVALTERGRYQASGMRMLLSSLPLDAVVVSGLPRTVETAAIILEGRDLPRREEPLLQEIQGGEPAADMPHDRILPDIAYAFWRAADAEGGRYRDGEPFEQFAARCRRGIANVIAWEDWDNLLLVAHGGVNRALLCWALGAPLAAFPVFEQDSCCLNIIDIDVAADGAIVRKYIRAVNITPYDVAKSEHRATTLEGMAKRMLATPKV
jgi:probable phosphoglycerate mutase